MQNKIMPNEKIRFEDRVWTSNNTWRAKTAEERLLEQSRGKIKPEVANLYIALTEKDL